MYRYIVVVFDVRDPETPDILEFHFTSADEYISSQVWADAIECVQSHGFTEADIEFVNKDPNDNDW